MVPVVEINTEYFKGPIAALLDLIEKKKLPIHEVSLQEVTASFLELCQVIQEESPDKVSYFLQIAATLLLLKSKALLPQEKDEEDESIESLKDRLRIYKAFRDKEEDFKTLLHGTQLLEGRYRIKKKVRFSPGGPMLIHDLEHALYQVLDRLPEDIRRPQANVAPTLNLKQVISMLDEDVKNGNVSFVKALSRSLDPKSPIRERKTMVAVVFLAMLEYVRGGTMNIMQKSPFSDITMTNEDV